MHKRPLKFLGGLSFCLLAACNQTNSRRPQIPDFLVQIELTGQLADAEKWQELVTQEARRARELGSLGILRRLWRIPGRRANWGIWTAADADELHNAIASLPLFPFMTVTVHALAAHPNDPRSSL